MCCFRGLLPEVLRGISFDGGAFCSQAVRGGKGCEVGLVCCRVSRIYQKLQIAFGFEALRSRNPNRLPGYTLTIKN